MNLLKERLASGKRLLGTHVHLSDHRICEMMGYVGFDYLWIDTEHTSTDLKELEIHLIAAKAGGVPSLVRVPWNEIPLIKHVIEMGPDGIVVPMVNTAEEARRAINACVYPPDGERGCGPFRAVRYGVDDLKEYIDKTSRDMVKLLQVESKTAVENLEEIASVPFVDGFVIGPFDMSGSIGKLSQVRDPENDELIERAIKIAHAKGKPIGLSVGICDEETTRHWFKKDLDFISMGADAAFMLEGAQKLLKTMRAQK